MAVAKELGYSLGGSYVKSIMSMIAYYGFDTSHFTGPAGSNRGNYKMENFCKNSKARTGNLRTALIGIRGHKCECCGLSEWQGRPIVLEIHHKDCDHHNQELDNLQLLCPNCHSLTAG